SRGVAFERFDVVAIRPLADADDDVEVVNLPGANGFLHPAPVAGNMLVADPDGGEPGQPGEFNHAGVVQVELGAGGKGVGANVAKDAARSHRKGWRQEGGEKRKEGNLTRSSRLTG